MYTPDNINRLFSTNPTIFSLLRDSDNPKMARHFLMSYMNELMRILLSDKSRIQPLEWALQTSCITTFRRIISVRSQRVSGFAIVKLLWLLAKDKQDELPQNLSDGFFEEMIHLFQGMRGKSHVYDHYAYPKFMNLEGREAAVNRSKQLDDMASHCGAFIKRYPSGLDTEILSVREENKKRILHHLSASAEDWGDYRWHLKNIIRDTRQLAGLIDLTDEEKKSIDNAKAAKLPFGITPYYVSLMDKSPSRKRDHAVRAQVIPPLDYVESMRQHTADNDCSFDFMMESDTSPIDLITRRYPNIAILKPYNTCCQICVYCQRNWEINDVMTPEALAPTKKIDTAIDWISRHPALNEILVTGGDPLVMSNEHIGAILEKLSAIEHIERIRIGSRTPVVLPQRVNQGLLETISKYHVPGRREVVLITHFEHPYEITPEALAAVQQFKQNGISVYNQTVFTIENSRRFELVALRRHLRLIGVDPYYTFNTKGKEETNAFRVPMARLQQEVNEEARLAPGIMRTDEPVYNVPRLGKNYIRAEQNHTLLTILPNGSRVYEFHPWEKNLALADTFVDTDVSIYDYLKRLERRGENMDDYQTIWYYF